ncbi:uncharacterized protein LOC124437369 [Xenia sp. Carnegie-2017]|uniref:uncharacterized protein LOC124437369 n=1 Tax=Xenia sp. Carnegie-2017 TaxID=2897299 RepID=UPI001F036AEB|nr:uncharacterized protein LOC124437369 [Xenia sp. Carnegie-2017]XP_046843304.1 uncharacterized protein LOC124437369 [Xenia sp. Carnegie-2017]
MEHRKSLNNIRVFVVVKRISLCSLAAMELNFCLSIFFYSVFVCVAIACPDGFYYSVDTSGCVKCKGKCSDQFEDDKERCRMKCETNLTTPASTSTLASSTSLPITNGSIKQPSLLPLPSKKNSTSNYALVVGLSCVGGLVVVVVCLIFVAYFCGWMPCAKQEASTKISVDVKSCMEAKSQKTVMDPRDKTFARQENGRDALINLVSNRYNSILPLQENSKTAGLG